MISRAERRARRWDFSSSPHPEAHRTAEPVPLCASEEHADGTAKWNSAWPLSWSRAARQWPGQALSMLFPDDCRVCAAPLGSFTRIPVCSGCLQSADPFLPEFFCIQCRTPFLNAFPLDENGCCSLCRLGGTRFDAAYSAGIYDGTLRKLIHLLKYDGVLSLSGPLGDLLWKALPKPQRFDVIVPAPMHWTRRLARGFNQAEVLARDLSRRMGIPVRTDLLRKKLIPPQTGLTSHQRRMNVAGAVRAASQLQAGAHVVLVDDVLTTGATANACALALRHAGAKQVSVLTVARADRRPGALPISTHSEEEFFVCRA